MSQSEHMSKNVEQVVFDVIEQELAVPRRRIRREDYLVRDLKIDTDDLSFLFIPKLEGLFGLRIPAEDWGNAYSIDDVINLIERYINARG